VDGGATYKSVPIEARKTSGQDGPSVRPAVAGDNTVYAAFFGWRKFNGTVATSDVVVVRDDTGGAGPNPFQALKDPSDKLPGRIVVKRVSIPWSNAPTHGAGTRWFDTFHSRRSEQQFHGVRRLGGPREQRRYLYIAREALNGPRRNHGPRPTCPTPQSGTRRTSRSRWPIMAVSVSSTSNFLAAAGLHILCSRMMLSRPFRT